MLEKYVTEITPYIEELFKNDSSGHDMDHLKRTMKIALKICKEEGGNELIVGISAFMHDIHRIMSTSGEEYVFVSPKDSIPKVKEILDKTDLNAEIKNSICFAIENHENYNWNGDNVDDINALILQDADNMDAIGAIGIARAFEGGGSYGVRIFNEEVPLESDTDFVEGAKDASVIHHFHSKLYRLEQNMNTKTAQEMAKKRVDYMKKFESEFLDEWNGIK